MHIHFVHVFTWKNNGTFEESMCFLCYHLLKFSTGNVYCTYSTADDSNLQVTGCVSTNPPFSYTMFVTRFPNMNLIVSHLIIFISSPGSRWRWRGDGRSADADGSSGHWWPQVRGWKMALVGVTPGLIYFN